MWTHLLWTDNHCSLWSGKLHYGLVNFIPTPMPCRLSNLKSTLNERELFFLMKRPGPYSKLVLKGPDLFHHFSWATMNLKQCYLSRMGWETYVSATVLFQVPRPQLAHFLGREFSQPWRLFCHSVVCSKWLSCKVPIPAHQTLQILSSFSFILGSSCSAPCWLSFPACGKHILFLGPFME